MKYYLGIDLGGTNIAEGICDENGKILIKGSVPTLASRDADEIVKDMASLALKLIKDLSIDISDIEYAGIASPGTADSERGIIVFCSSMPFLQYPLAAKFSEFSGIKEVYIENDANAAAKGEAACGAAKGVANSIMITIGTGIGGGIIIDNKVYSGFNFAGAEVGHLVIKHGGIPCACGRRGCWECYGSATALIRMTKEKMSENPDSLMWELCKGDINAAGGRTAFTAMKQGDRAASETVREFIEHFASGIVSMINIFSPEILSIGGGVSNEGEYLLKPLREIVEREQYSRNSPCRTVIKIAQLGNDAGIIGAAMLRG